MSQAFAGTIQCTCLFPIHWWLMETALHQSRYQSSKTLSERHKLFDNAQMRGRLQSMYRVESEATQRFQNLLEQLDEACSRRRAKHEETGPGQGQIRQ